MSGLGVRPIPDGYALPCCACPAPAVVWDAGDGWCALCWTLIGMAGRESLTPEAIAFQLRRARASAPEENALIPWLAAQVQQCADRRKAEKDGAA